MADLHSAIAKIIATAWADKDFLQSLTDAGDDRERIDKILEKKDLEIPDIPGHPSGKVRFIANTKDVRHVVIPEPPEFTDEDMGLMVKLRQAQCDDTTCKACMGTDKKNLWDSIVKILGNP